MSNGKEDLKNQLQSIKDNLDKKLSEATVSNQKKSPKKNINSTKSRTSNKKKPIPIKVDMEVVSVVKKEEANKKKITEKSKKEKQEEKPKVSSKKPIAPPTKVKKEKRKKKKKLPVLPIILLIILLGSLAYIYSLKKGLKEDENKFEKDKAEAIDYSEDVYFKEVEDEVDDEEMQDFAVYKDVPEVVAENNSKSKVLTASVEKSINQQISQKEAIQKNNTVTANTGISEAAKEIVSSESVKPNEQNTSNPQSVSQPKTTTSSETKKDMVYADMIRVVGLEHKDGNFTLPKKVKRTNAFKIRIRLKKNQISDSDKDNEIMLVIKDSNGKTVKIDSKKVNFKKQNSKVLNLEFYEIFPERLKTNTNYSFSVFADRKLIKSYRKSI